MVGVVVDSLLLVIVVFACVCWGVATGVVVSLWWLVVVLLIALLIVLLACVRWGIVVGGILAIFLLLMIVLALVR